MIHLPKNSKIWRFFCPGAKAVPRKSLCFLLNVGILFSFTLLTFSFTNHIFITLVSIQVFFRNLYSAITICIIYLVFRKYFHKSKKTGTLFNFQNWAGEASPPLLVARLHSNGCTEGDEDSNVSSY